MLYAPVETSFLASGSTGGATVTLIVAEVIWVDVSAT